MKNKDLFTWMFNAFLVFLVVFVLCACGGGKNTGSDDANNTDDTSATEPEIGAPVSDDQEERITLVEEVEQDNCNGPETSISKGVSLSTNQSWSVSVSGSLEASAPGISASLGSSLQSSYGQTKGLQTTINLPFPAGTHQVYTVEHYEIWELGSIDVSVGQDLFSVPYAYRISAGLRSYGPEIIECPTPVPPDPPQADFSMNQTAGTVPFSVQFTDLSEGLVTNWLWDFGDGNTSNDQNPSHTFNAPSYAYKTANVCYESNPYTVSLEAENSGGASQAIQEGVINVLPKEYSVTTQIEPYALKEGTGYKLLHNPGCSKGCGLDISSGTTTGISCLTSVKSESTDETGYYFEGQMIGLQAIHRITYCPAANPKIKTGIWEFERWSDPEIKDSQISAPDGDHNPILEIHRDYYIQVHYVWVADCP